MGSSVIQLNKIELANPQNEIVENANRNEQEKAISSCSETSSLEATFDRLDGITMENENFASELDSITKSWGKNGHISVSDSSTIGEVTDVEKRETKDLPGCPNKSAEILRWEALQNERWGPSRIPYISSIKKKLKKCGRAKPGILKLL